MHGNDLLLGCQQILASFSPVWDDLSSDLSFFLRRILMSRSHEMAISCRNVDVEETTYYLLTVRPYTATRHTAILV
jgi:hypothetical protein